MFVQVAKTLQTAGHCLVEVLIHWTVGYLCVLAAAFVGQESTAEGKQTSPLHHFRHPLPLPLLNKCTGDHDQSFWQALTG